MNEDLRSRQGFKVATDLGKLLEKLHTTVGIPVEILADDGDSNGVRKWRLRSEGYSGKPFHYTARYRMYLAPE